MLQKLNHKSLKKKITSSGVMTIAGIAAAVLFGIGGVAAGAVEGAAGAAEGVGLRAAAATTEKESGMELRQKAGEKIAKFVNKKRARKKLAAAAAEKAEGGLARPSSALGKQTEGGGASLTAGGGGGGVVKTGSSLRKGPYFLSKINPNKPVSLHVASFGYYDYLESDLQRRGLRTMFQNIETPEKIQIPEMGNRAFPDGSNGLGNKNRMVQKILSQSEGPKVVILVDDSRTNITSLHQAAHYWGDHEVHGLHIVNTEEKLGMSTEESTQLLHKLSTELSKTDDREVALVFDADETMYNDHMAGTINWYVGQGLRRHMAIYRTLGETRGGLVEGIKEPGLSTGFTQFIKYMQENFTFHPG